MWTIRNGIHNRSRSMCASADERKPESIIVKQFIELHVRSDSCGPLRLLHFSTISLLFTRVSNEKNVNRIELTVQIVKLVKTTTATASCCCCCTDQRSCSKIYDRKLACVCTLQCAQMRKCRTRMPRCTVAHRMQTQSQCNDGGNERMRRRGKNRHMKNWQSEQNRYLITCRCIESSISMHVLGHGTLDIHVIDSLMSTVDLSPWL